MAGVGATSRAYGLSLASDLHLPYLLPATSEPDCLVQFGDVAHALDAPVASGVDWEAETDRVLISAPVGRFLVEPHQIVVDQSPNADHSQLAFVVMHGCLAPLLHLRGMLVLHAAAVEVPGLGVVAIAGQSACGKSTLLMACARRGWRMVTDELSAISFDSSQPWVAAGPPMIQVWREALNHFNVPADDLRPVRPNLQKYAWPAAGVTERAAPLLAVVLLEPAALPIELRRIHGAAALGLLRAQIRTARIAEAVRPAGVFSALAALADRVPIFRLSRPEGAIESVDGLVDCLAALSL